MAEIKESEKDRKKLYILEWFQESRQPSYVSHRILAVDDKHAREQSIEIIRKQQDEMKNLQATHIVLSQTRRAQVGIDNYRDVPIPVGAFDYLLNHDNPVETRLRLSKMICANMTRLINDEQAWQQWARNQISLVEAEKSKKEFDKLEGVRVLVSNMHKQLDKEDKSK